MAKRGSTRELLSNLKEKARKNKTMSTEFQVEDIYEKCTSSILKKKLLTGLVFNENFKLHKCIWDLNYPEKPERYTCILDRFKYYDLINRCKEIEGREATTEELSMLHDRNIIEFLDNTQNIKDAKILEEHASKYDAIYFNEHTAKSARLAAGSVLELMKAVVKGEVQNGMAIVRPPGHHAMHNEYCGYCYYNNVGLAAKYALNNLNINRILIVDWDVHHGQATQQMFYDDPRVMYFSIHRYEYGKFWPNLRESNFDYIGSDGGKYYNVNIPLNETGCGDADYLTIFHSLLIPLAYEFQPELILISAGYDAAIGCFEGEMKVSPGCYHHLTTVLMSLAQGKIVTVLEGGYFLPSLAESASQTLKALLGDPAPFLDTLSKPKESVLEVVYNIITLLRNKWNCFKYFAGYESEINADDEYKGEVAKPPYETRNCYPKHTPEQQKYFEEIIIRLQKCYYEDYPRSKVGFLYDNSMVLHTSSNQNSLEKAERITKTIEILNELELFDRMQKEHCFEATDEELLMFHVKEYLTKIASIETLNEKEIMLKNGWSTVFTNSFTNKAARMAAGGLINLTKSVLQGNITSGVALIRPPGHHAEHNAACGFCIFNNVVLAAKHALYTGIERILILDWDIHHGNGIQHAFYDNPKVLYLSLHRYDDRKFFPFSSDADTSQTGEKEGQGYNINICWNNATMKNGDYISAFSRIVLPVAYEYNPQLVIIAAGFDACVGDPLGGYKLTPEIFGHFVQMMKPLAGGRIILALEGGYNINSVAYSFAMCCKALLNDPLPILDKIDTVCEEACNGIHKTIKEHNKKWNFLLKGRKNDSSANN